MKRKKRIAEEEKRAVNEREQGKIDDKAEEKNNRKNRANRIKPTETRNKTSKEVDESVAPFDFRNTGKPKEEAKSQPTPSDVVIERPSREAAGDDYVGQYNKYLDYLEAAKKTNDIANEIIDARSDLEDRISDSKSDEEREELKELFARARNISTF